VAEAALALLTNFIKMRSKRPGWAAAGCRSSLDSALSGRRRIPVDFDELDEPFDPEVGERQDAVVVETVDPDDNVLDVHFDAVARPDPRLFRGRQRSRDRERGHEMAVGLGCATDAESRAWEALMRAYIVARTLSPRTSQSCAIPLNLECSL
jgi:hypothetical protein